MRRQGASPVRAASILAAWAEQKAVREMDRPRIAVASRGFYELLEAISDPTHECHAEAKEWADECDPDAVDELPIKYAFRRIANRRNAARVRIAKNS